jgi:hypothetical protein
MADDQTLRLVRESLLLEKLLHVIRTSSLGSRN